MDWCLYDGNVVFEWIKANIGFNSFVSNAPFVYPLKISENRKGALGTNRLKDSHEEMTIHKSLLMSMV